MANGDLESPDPRQAPLKLLRQTFTALLVLLPAALHGQSTFDLTVRGTSCSAPQPSGSLHCTYKVGKDLEFSITSIGEPNATITVLKANIDGDFFLRVGMIHGCAIVEAGAKAPKSASSPDASGALVSPQTGRVVRTWAECDAEQAKGGPRRRVP